MILTAIIYLESRLEIVNTILNVHILQLTNSTSRIYSKEIYLGKSAKYTLKMFTEVLFSKFGDNKISINKK